jgi:DnaJ-domain-containing protein 1
MNKRPFLNKRIDELERIFRDAGSDGQVLRILEGELVNRKTPRAVNLLRKVGRLLSNPALASGGPEPTLFGPRSHQPSPPACSSVSNERESRPNTGFTLQSSELPKPTVTPTRPESVPTQQPVCHSEPIPFPLVMEQVSLSAPNQIVSLEDACKILHVTLGSDWETVEKARSQIVQRSHPDHLKGLPEGKRRELVRAAKLANIAAKALLDSRISDGPRSSAAQEEAENTPERVLIRMPMKTH